jgi:hypothetical protein
VIHASRLIGAKERLALPPPELYRTSWEPTKEETAGCVDAEALADLAALTAEVGPLEAARRMFTSRTPDQPNEGDRQ